MIIVCGNLFGYDMKCTLNHISYNECVVGEGLRTEERGNSVYALTTKTLLLLQSGLQADVLISHFHRTAQSSYV